MRAAWPSNLLWVRSRLQEALSCVEGTRRSPLEPPGSASDWAMGANDGCSFAGTVILVSSPSPHFCLGAFVHIGHVRCLVAG